MPRRAAPKKGNRINVQQEGNVFAFLSELEEVLTPIAAEADEDLFTGDYHQDFDSSTNIKTITLYTKTDSAAVRNRGLTTLYREVEEHILDVRFHGLDVYLDIPKSGNKAIDVIIVVPDERKNVVANNKTTYEMGGTVYKSLKRLRYILKPSASASASNPLYKVTAQECLQCLACALRQALGKKLEVNDLTNYVNYFDFHRISSSNYPLNDQAKNALHTNVAAHTEYNTGTKKGHVGTHQDVCQFGAANPDWIESSVTIANKLAGSKWVQGETIFCHADAKLVSWYWAGFEKARLQILNNMSLFKGMNANELDRNKWNPADMFAIRQSFNAPGSTWPGITTDSVDDQDMISENELKTNLKARGKKQGSVINLSAQIDKHAEKYDTVSGMPSLNKYLYSLRTGGCIPISLKKVKNSASIDELNIPGAVKATATATLEEVNWANDFRGRATNKVEVHFSIKHGMARPAYYYINARQFNEGADIKFQIEKTGGMAFHGKAGLNIGKIIINKTSPAMKPKMNTLRANVKKNNPDFDVGTKLFADKNDIKETYGKSPTSLLDYASILSTNAITKMPPTASGNISKVQAAEFGYMMRNPTEKGLTSHILYSLFMYAGSQGLVLYDGTAYKKYYSASWYIKIS